MSTKRPTKTQIDELAILRHRYDAAKAEADRCEKLYKKALAPVATYVDERITPTQAMSLTGVLHTVEFGKARAVRKLIDPRTALSLLERVKAGLGFAHISIPIKVLDENLRAEETKGLYEVEYGARSVKVTDLDE